MKKKLHLLALIFGMSSLTPLPSAADQAAGPFKPEWKSLRQYKCPEWFRDAKFGIYAHWGVFSAALGSQNTDW